MNKLIILFLLWAVPFKAQIKLNSSLQKKQHYYWFSMSIGKSYDRETDSYRIYTKDVGNEIGSGFFEDFVNAHDQGLKRGRIVLGPYTESYHAQNAQLLYRNAGRGTYSSLKKKYSDEEEFEYSFFYTKPILSDTVSNICFERIPARVTIGNQNDFIGMLGEGLNFENLAIGPFYEYESSERSKFVFRKNGENSEMNKTDSLNAIALANMAKRWKSLKFQIAKKSEDKETNTFIYRISTNFHKGYFSADAYQVIKITASYNDSFETSSSCFTLQGDDVIDNNYSIASKSNTIYINMLQFANNSPSKLNGFFIESFIYNNFNLIELDPVYVEAK